jgi:FkbM family methyltransferase
MSYRLSRRFHSAVKAFYNKIARRYPGIACVWRYFGHREAAFPFRRTFAVPELHAAIKKEFGNYSSGVFFEAGANDGLLFSNTAYLERYQAWTGILVEALPHKFVECVRNRRNAIVEHCALVAPDYDETAVELRYGNLMSFAPALSAIDESGQIETAKVFMSDQERVLANQTFIAPARTISYILGKYGIRHINLMILDLEGAELQALRGIDFDKVRIDNILIEVRALEEMDTFLILHGYHRSAQWADFDYLYKFNGR